MSIAASIILVLGLFTFLGLVAWRAVAVLSASSRHATPAPVVVEDSRELVGQHAG